MYVLRGAVGTGEGVRRFADGLGDAVVVPLRQGFSLVPVTNAVYARVTGRRAGPCGLDFLPEPLARLVEEASEDGAIAFLEADFFGGEGEQIAWVWEHGEQVSGPVRMDDAPGAGTPISQALRQLGVVADGGDEFDALSLGWQRETEDWLDRWNWPPAG